MAIEAYIENHAAFTQAELLEACGDTQTNKNLLSVAVKKGKAVRVRRGVYASNAGRHRAAELDPLALVPKLDPDAVVCYATALDVHVGFQDFLYRTTFYSRLRVEAPFGQRTLKSYPPPPHVSWKRYIVGGLNVAATTPEQTMIDCFAHPERAGGVEAVIKSLNWLGFIDPEGILEGLHRSNATTRARVGWYLDRKREDWGVPPELLSSLVKGLGPGPYYLTRHKVTTEGSWDAKWRLYLTEPQETMDRWLSE